MIKVIGILLALAVVCQCDSSAVPVLFYEKDMGNSDNTVTVGQPLSSADFTAMLTTFKGDVDVILVDELSDQDLRGLLKDLRSAASIHYEPAVMSAYPALKSFLDSSRIPFNIHDMQMDVGRALREFNSRQGKSNAVILTALQTRQPRAISKRDIPEAQVPLTDARNYTDVTGSNCAASFESIYFMDMNDLNSAKRIDITIDSTRFDCSEAKSTLTLMVSSDQTFLGSKLQEISLVFVLTDSLRYWKLSDNSSVKTSVGPLGVTYLGSPYSLETPNTFSFVCTRTYFQLYNGTIDTKPLVKVAMYINYLQVQPSLLETNGTDIAFGRPNYCTGFFTSGIWMGIFSSLLLALILSAGVSCLWSINTMDRFDDPKGKPLTIAQEK